MVALLRLRLCCILREPPEAQHPSFEAVNQKQLVVQPNCVQQTVQVVVLPFMKYVCVVQFAHVAVATAAMKIPKSAFFMSTP